MRVGVLGLQGGFREHREALRRLDVDTTDVRLADDLAGLDALVIPGGESTTIGKSLRRTGLDQAIGDLPLFGTCAGMILCAARVEGGTGDQLSLNRFDASVRRNGVGTQKFSFETEVSVGGELFTAVFIRPPVVESVGDEVEVLAALDDSPVLCRQGKSLFASFHPELSGDDRIHQLFLDGL